MQKFIDNFKPNIIHSHLWEAEVVCSCLKTPNTSKVTHFHDNMIQLHNLKLSFKKSSITNYYEKRFFLRRSKNNKYITISKNTHLYAKENLPKKLIRNIYLLPNAISYKSYYNKIRKYKKDINIIYTASFVEKKNHSLALKIIKIINKTHKVKLTLLGKGPTLEIIKKEAKELGVYDIITFKGHVENVKKQLDNSNIYLHTAHYEPFGLVIIEAMANGLPVVTLNGGGNEDFIKNNKNGYIISSNDPQLFSNHIIKLFNNEALYQNISTQGQNTAKNYDINEYSKKLIEFYNEVIISEKLE